MNNEEDPRIKQCKTLKRILILVVLYGIVILYTPECRSALPGLTDCLRFYYNVMHALANL